MLKKNELCNQIQGHSYITQDTRPGTEMSGPKAARRDMSLLKDLQSQYESAKEHVNSTSRKHRAIVSNWRNGIVGVEVPCDDPSNAQLYKEQSAKMAQYRKRH